MNEVKLYPIQNLVDESEYKDNHLELAHILGVTREQFVECYLHGVTSEQYDKLKPYLYCHEENPDDSDLCLDDFNDSKKTKGKKPPGFMLFAEKGVLIRQLDDKQGGELLRALFDFHDTGKELETDDQALKMDFEVCKADIERGRKYYNKKCENNSKAAQSRWIKEGKKPKLKRTNIPQIESHDYDFSEIEKTLGG